MPRIESWKLTVMAAVAVIGSVPMFSHTWDAAQLAAYLGLFFVARGALHLVAMPTWQGLGAAAGILRAAGEVGAGIVLMVWPQPTIYAIAIITGVWCITSGVFGTTIAVTTRDEEPRWLVLIGVAAVDVALGIVLVARAETTVDAVASLLGVIALVHGGVELVIAAAHPDPRRSRRGARHRRVLTPRRRDRAHEHA